jgi:hypothetical protein
MAKFGELMFEATNCEEPEWLKTEDGFDEWHSISSDIHLNRVKFSP